MNDLPVIITLALAMVACLYAEWKLSCPIKAEPRKGLGLWAIKRIVEVR